MKEYKLIQWYPSLPKEWKDEKTIVVVKRFGGYVMHPSLTHLSNGTIKYEEIENSPEFWEEVKPQPKKDYEILSFISDDKILNIGEGMTIEYENNDTSYIKVTEDFQKYVIGFKIHSVKRLSDGEIFTIGDRISSKNRKWNNVFIEKFMRYDGSLFVKNSSKRLHDISNIKLNKQPLLTTEDGVDLFEGDTYFRVLTNFTITELKLREFFNSYAGAKFFSTKEAAEEYIIREKPVLNAIEIYETLKPYITTMAFNNLKEKIREKLGYK